MQTYSVRSIPYQKAAGSITGRARRNGRLLHKGVVASTRGACRHLPKIDHVRSTLAFIFQSRAEQGFAPFLWSCQSTAVTSDDDTDEDTANVR